ncbi:MAG: response regulator transcription factor [Planctomycetes bacterium]|nr:response regulator transcription factor [Planctomycetota bacterium]
MTHLLIIASVRLYAEGLRACLSEDARFSRVDVAQDCSAALASVSRSPVDLALLDTQLASSLESLGDLRRLRPDLPVVALAAESDPALVLRLTRGGVAGILLRDASVDDLLRVLACVLRREFACSPELSGIYAEILRSPQHFEPQASQALQELLTHREEEIAELIRSGFSNKEIAHRLSISVSTVKNHVHRILEKLGIDRRAHVGALCAMQVVASR